MCGENYKKVKNELWQNEGDPYFSCEVLLCPRYNQYYKEDTQQCFDCLSGCAHCEDGSTCLECEKGYGLLVDDDDVVHCL